MQKGKNMPKQVDINFKSMDDLIRPIKDKTKKSSLSYEKALSRGLVYSLERFNDTSQTNKWEAKAIGILSCANPTMKEILQNIVWNRKDFKRKRAKEWERIIKNLANSMRHNDNNNPDDSKGFMSFLRKER